MAELIKRDSALKGYDTVLSILDRAVNAVSEAKAIVLQYGSEPEQRWIPCSERLPEELEEVNVTWVNHKPEPYYDFVKDKSFTASAVYYKGDWYWYSSVCTDLLAECGENEIDKIDDAIEITAWMPLPEPWEGDQP